MAQNLEGYTIVQSALGTIYFQFGAGVSINPSAYLSVTPTSPIPTGEGKLQLKNRAGAILLDIEYADGPPWPKEADGAGHSLVLARPSFGENDARSWAASRVVGGSRDQGEANIADPLNAIKINEFLANPSGADVDFIELFNASGSAVDISGCWLSCDNDHLTDGSAMRIPNGTILPPRGFVVYFRVQHFTFNLSPNGEAIFLTNPSGTRVIDAVDFNAQESGVTTGRTPDGTPGYQRLATRTAGTANSVPASPGLVINEIMFHPLSGNGDDEFVEIRNTNTTAVALDRWRIRGIDFTFPVGASIAANGFVVVAFNPSALGPKYSGLTNDVNLFGSWSGKLGRNGDRLVLAKPLNAGDPATPHIDVDEVIYADGGRWGRWADGDGASLELVDARADNRRSANWSDSAEPTTNAWTSIEYTGPIELGENNSPRNALEIILLGEGECLLDNAIVVQGGSSQTANTNFNSDSTGWLWEGNHELTARQSTGGVGNTACLRIRTSGNGDQLANRLVGTNTALPNTGNASIGAQVRWLRGHPETTGVVRRRGWRCNVKSHQLQLRSFDAAIGRWVDSHDRVDVVLSERSDRRRSDSGDAGKPDDGFLRIVARRDLAAGVGDDRSRSTAA